MPYKRRRSISTRELEQRARDAQNPNSLRNRLRRIAEHHAKEAIKDLERKYGRD